MLHRTWVGDKRIDAYIAALPPVAHSICGKLRQLIHDAAPEIKEE